MSQVQFSGSCSQDPGSQGLMSRGPGSRVSGPDFKLCFEVGYLFLSQNE